jgi:chromosome segregation ATPase
MDFSEGKARLQQALERANARFDELQSKRVTLQNEISTLTTHRDKVDAEQEGVRAQAVAAKEALKQWDDAENTVNRSSGAVRSFIRKWEKL